MRQVRVWTDLVNFRLGLIWIDTGWTIMSLLLDPLWGVLWVLLVVGILRELLRSLLLVLVIIIRGIGLRLNPLTKSLTCAIMVLVIIINASLLNNTGSFVILKGLNGVVKLRGVLWICLALLGLGEGWRDLLSVVLGVLSRSAIIVIIMIHILMILRPITTKSVETGWVSDLL